MGWKQTDNWFVAWLRLLRLKSHEMLKLHMYEAISSISMNQTIISTFFSLWIYKVKKSLIFEKTAKLYINLEKQELWSC